jgi:hypothetical protein
MESYDFMFDARIAFVVMKAIRGQKSKPQSNAGTVVQHSQRRRRNEKNRRCALHFVHSSYCADCSEVHEMKDAERDNLLERFPEINFANYGQDEVEALQAWAFEAHDALSEQASAKHKRLSDETAGGGKVKLPKLSDELRECYPPMSAQTHEHHVKAYARAAIALNTTGTQVQDAQEKTIVVGLDPSRGGKFESDEVDITFRAGNFVEIKIRDMQSAISAAYGAGLNAATATGAPK